MKLTPTKIKVKDLQKDIETDRHTYLGGSEVAAIMGLSPYKSAYTLWSEKCGFYEEEDKADHIKLAAYLGHENEQTIADLFQEESGMKVRKTMYRYSLKEYPFLGVHLDRLIRTPDKKTAILECKTTFSRHPWDGYDRGEIPPAYYCQVMVEMAVTGIHKAYIAVLRTGPVFDYWEVPYNEEEAQLIIKTCVEFWNMVTRKEWTPETDSIIDLSGSAPASTKEALSYMHRYYWDEPAAPVMIDNDSLEIISELDAKIKAMTEEKSRLSNQVKLQMEGAEKALSKKSVVRYRTVDTNRFDSASFRKDHPDLYKEYLKPSSYDRFTIENRKEN